MPDTISVKFGRNRRMLEKISHLCQAESFLQLIDIDAIVVANTHLRSTSDDLVADVRPHILIILLILKPARVDKLTDPLSRIVVLFAASNLVSAPLLDLLDPLRPAVHFDVAVEKGVLPRHHAELRVGDWTVHFALAAEKDRFGPVCCDG